MLAGRGSRFVAALVLTLLAALAGIGLAEAADAPGRGLLPAIEPAKAATACVAEPAVMRREHMKLLKHQRELTVHRGERDGRDSLQACITCHASKTTGSVAAAPTDFCASCHAYAAVRIDCFECHASRLAAAQAALSGVAR
jgi:hypothetical protein